MAMTEHFVEILPRHQRLLERLIEQKKVDMLGAIGWRGLLEGDDDWTMDELFQPLIERGLVEDLTANPDFGAKGGQYFVRITALGNMCASFGWMPKVRHKTSTGEFLKFSGELPRPDTSNDPVKFVNDPPTAEQREHVIGTA